MHSYVVVRLVFAHRAPEIFVPIALLDATWNDKLVTVLIVCTVVSVTTCYNTLHSLIYRAYNLVLIGVKMTMLKCSAALHNAAFCTLTTMFVDVVTRELSSLTFLTNSWR